MPYTAHSVEELRSLIQGAPDNVMHVIELLPGMKYELNAPAFLEGWNGFPIISSQKIIRIVGRGASLVRREIAGTPFFRFFEVETGGWLELIQLKFQNGTIGGTASPLFIHHGGALFNKGTVHIKYCDFVDNIVLTRLTPAISGTPDSFGGAIANNEGSLIVQGSAFRNNQAVKGGAIHNDNGNLDLTNCMFENNRTIVSLIYGNGGAVGTYGGDVTIRQSRFSQNYALTAGGAIHCTDTTLLVTGSDFTENRTVVDITGGCFYNASGSEVALHFNQFYGNGGGPGIQFGAASGTEVDATNNWWGAALGPSIGYVNTYPRDSVSEEGVIYEPFLTSETAIHSNLAECRPGLANISYATTDQATSKNPISLIRGEKRWVQTDIKLESPLTAIEFTRTYRQSLQDELQFMGLGWTHNHVGFVEPISIGSPNSVDVDLQTGGRIRLYETSSTGKFEGAAGSNTRLTFSGSPSYTMAVLKAADKSKFRFEIIDSGNPNSRYRLVSRTWPNGNRWTYTYDVNARLTSVQDDWGRKLVFFYYGGTSYKEGQLNTVEAINEGVSVGIVAYDYTPEMENGAPVSNPKALLSSVTDLLNNTWTYDYFGSKSGETGSDPTPLNFMTARRSPPIQTQGNGVVDLERLNYFVDSGAVTSIVQRRGDDDELVETEFEFSEEGHETTETVATSIRTHSFKRGLLENTIVAEENANTGRLEPTGVFRPGSQADAYGNMTWLGWNDDGEFLTDVINPAGAITSFDYERDEQGDFNEDSRFVRLSDADGRRTHYLYDDDLRQPTLVLVSNEQVSIDVKGDMDNVADWTKIDSSTTNELSLDVTAGYFRRVVADSSGDGIESNAWDFVDGRTYVLSARVFPVASCAVTLQVPGVPALELNSVGSNAWEELSVSFVANTNLTDRVVQAIASVSGEFYLDAVSLIEDGRELLNDRFFERSDTPAIPDWRGIGGHEPTMNERRPGADTGGHSRHVVAATGYGIKSAEEFSITAEKKYLLSARIFVVSGEVTMQVLGVGGVGVSTAATLGVWQTIRTLYTATTSVSSLNVAFTAEGGSAEFYVDSVHLVELDAIYSWQEYRYDYAWRTVEERSIDVDTLKVSRELTREYYVTTLFWGMLEKLTHVDPDGVTNNNWTTYEYDHAGRTTLVHKGSVFGNCDVTYTVYDTAGNVVATICNYSPGADPAPSDAQEAANLYDAEKPNENRVTTFAHDELGRQYLVTTNAGSDFAITNYTVLDSLDRPRLSISNYENPEVSPGVRTYTEPYTWAWDGDKWIDGSDPAKVIDHGPNKDRNIVSQTVYNELGLTRLQRDVAGKVALSGYDRAGRLIRSVLNASQPAFNNRFNGGDPTLEMYPGEGIALNSRADQDIIQFSQHNAVGNVVKSTSNPDFPDVSRTTLTTYDALNRPHLVVSSASAPAYEILADRQLASYVFNSAPDLDLVTETSYDLMGRVLETKDEMGRITRTVYDVQGRLIRSISNYHSQTGADGNVVDPSDWHWQDGRWMYLFDPIQTTYYPVEHNSLGTMIGIADQNLVTETIYDGAGRVLETRDILGRVTRFVYDGLGRQTKSITNYAEQITVPDEWQWRIVSGEGAWRLSATSNMKVSFGDDNDQNLIIETSYDGDGRPFEVRNAEGLVTRTVYDELGRTSKTIRNYVEQSTEPHSWEWREESSKWAWRLSDETTDLVDHGDREDQNLITQTHYDAQGRPELIRDNRGVAAFSVYDKQGRQVKTIANYIPQTTPPVAWIWRLDAAETEYAWRLSDDNDTEVSHGADNDQNIISATEEFDLLGRVVFTRDVAGHATVRIYDELGRQVRIVTSYVVQGATDPKDWVWRTEGGVWGWYAADSGSTLVSHGTDNDVNLISDTHYDKAGRVVLTRDASGTSTAFTYDRAGRQRNVTTAAETGLATTSYACFDKAGRTLRRIDNWIDNGVSPDERDTAGNYVFDPELHGIDNDQNLITRIVLDELGRVYRQSNPAGDSTTSFYDLDSSLVQQLDPLAVSTRYVHDRQRRTTKVVQNYYDQRMRIAFSSNRDRTNAAESDIFTMNRDGTNVVRLTSDGVVNEAAAWSRDGTKIAFFRRTTSGHLMIYTMDSDGAALTAITDTDADHLYPAWSADSTKIVCKGYNVSSYVLKVMDSDGGNKQVLWEPPANRDIYHPNWSWANNKVVFELNHTDAALESDIAVVNSNGSGFALLVADGNKNRNPVWSPDGTRIAFDSRTVENLFQIYVMRHDGTDVTQLTFTAQANVNPTWSPDGRQIMFYSRRDGLPERQLYVMNADGTNQRRVTVNESSDNDVAWAPIQTDPAAWEWVTDHWENEDGDPIVHGDLNDTNVIVAMRNDIAGRPIEVRNPGGATTAYRYDALGRRIVRVMNYVPQGTTDPADWVWSVANDRWERGASDTTAISHGPNGDENMVMQMRYVDLDAPGDVTGQTRTITVQPNGTEIVRDFDRLGRPLTIGYDDLRATPDVTFAHDIRGNRVRMTETGISGTVRETLYSYDGAQRLITASFDTDGDSTVDETVGYAYDVSGRRTQLAMPGSKTVDYTFDARGQMRSLTDWSDQTTRFRYDAMGRHVLTRRANGLRSLYQYDAGGRLRLLRHDAGARLLAQFGYEVDARGNRTQAFEAQRHPGSGTTIIDQSDDAVYYYGDWTTAGGFHVTAQPYASFRLTFAGNENVELTMGEGPDHGLYDVYIGGSLWQSFNGYAANAGERVIPIPLSNDGPFTLHVKNRADKARHRPAT
ncbi:MAG: PD40 domain-containing protein [Chloroflexi bacterium]|nr:PD40 domain-containing protein [Chloroflexota bacterium]